MTRNPEIPGSSNEAEPLQSQSIAGSTNTADSADVEQDTPISTEDQIQDDTNSEDDSQ